MPPSLVQLHVGSGHVSPTVSAAVWAPTADAGAPALVLAPGAGSRFDAPQLCWLAEDLADRGHPVVTFNFPYTEVGRRAPDPKVRLISAFRDAVAAVPEIVGARPRVLGGRSLGGRVASMLVASGHQAAGLLLLSYPLHPPRRHEFLRTEHWPALRTPTLLVTGTRDPLCDPALLDASLPLLASAAVSVVRIKGADHALAVRRRDGRTAEEVRTEVTGAVAAWLRSLPAGGRAGAREAGA